MELSVKLKQMNTYAIFIDQFNLVYSWETTKFLSKTGRSAEPWSKCAFILTMTNTRVKMVRWLDRAMVFLPLGKPLEKLIHSLIKLIYTDCLHLCDWAVRTLINVFFYFIFFYFTTQTLLLSFLLIQLGKTFPNAGTMTEQMTHRKSTRGIWASLSFSFFLTYCVTIWMLSLTAPPACCVAWRRASPFQGSSVPWQDKPNEW